MNLLDAIGSNLSQFVYLSTFHVYGVNGHGIVTEKTPLAATHPYATTHALSEHYISMYARQKGYGTALIRLSNGYGAPLYADVNRWTLVVNDLCRQAITQQKIVLRSSGLQVRDFVEMSDIIQAIELVVNRPKRDIQIYNVGGLKTYTVLDVAQTVQRIYTELYAQHLPLERPTPNLNEIIKPLDYQCQPIQRLGYTPRTTLEHGIRETLKFCHQEFVDMEQE